MKKDLLIFPGGGSPNNSLYHDVYQLLYDEAKKIGYENISVLSWPGHSNAQNEFPSALTMSGAMKVASARVREQEATARPFDILARSFGTVVAVSCVREENPVRNSPQILTEDFEVVAVTMKQKRPDGLERLILWGPPPYWVMWELFERDFCANEKKNRDKGLRVSLEFFSGLPPFEALLKDITVETTVATGREDPHCTPEFHGYLKAMYGGGNRIRFPEPVVGCKHEVTADNPNWGKYIVALFGK